MQFWNLWPVSSASFLHNLNGILVKEVKSRRNASARIVTYFIVRNFLYSSTMSRKVGEKKKKRKWKEFYT